MTNIGKKILVMLTAIFLSALLLSGSARNLANLQMLSIIQGNRDEQLNPSASLYLQGIAAFEKQKYARAVSLFGRAKSVDSSLIRWYLAKAYNGSGDWLLALDLLDTNVAAEQDLYASILFDNLPDLTAKEQQEWEQRIRHNYPGLILPYARHLLNRQQYKKAEKWARLTPNYSNSVLAQLVVGESLLRGGYSPEAEEVFRLAYEQHHTAESAYWYGRTLRFNGKPELAVPVLEEAIRKKQSNTVSWYLRELGLAYAEVGRCSRAMSALDRALQRDPRVENSRRVEAARDKVVQICPVQAVESE
jgi:tetratricopeptide (TPR) repeat protein